MFRTYHVQSVDRASERHQWPELPSLDIDFAVVDGGDQILGAPNAFNATGADVPRIACKLVNIKR